VKKKASMGFISAVGIAADRSREIKIGKRDFRKNSMSLS
jgi:hypothetical protein